MSSLVERVRRMLRGELPPPPVARLVGFAVRSAEGGRAIVTFEAGPQHANPMGTVHGGILADVADAAMGFAYLSTLAEGESFTTLEFKINFLKPVRDGRLRAEGRVVKRGRTIGLTACDLADDQGQLVAFATSTCMTLRGEQARGR